MVVRLHKLYFDIFLVKIIMQCLACHIVQNVEFGLDPLLGQICQFLVENPNQRLVLCIFNGFRQDCICSLIVEDKDGCHAID